MMHPEALFKIANTAVLPFWLLLGCAPRSPYTAKIVRSGAVSVVIAGAYILCLGQGGKLSLEGFGSLAAVRQTFADDWFLLAAWLHYLAFDLFVGAAITSDFVQRGGSRFVLAIELFFTLMLGPVGLLLHKARSLISRRF